MPYEANEGAEYEIPEQDFEEVIQSYFQIEREQIAAIGPYPEVISYEEQEDGTIRLFIEAVWERKMTDHAVTSELVVRPLEDGSFQYVSNQVTGWDNTLEILWYTPRLTDEEWQYYYADIQNG